MLAVLLIFQKIPAFPSLILSDSQDPADYNRGGMRRRFPSGYAVSGYGVEGYT